MTRDEMLQALRAAVLGAGWIRAAWIGGSDATGRTDAWSDIDLQVVTDLARADDAFALVEQCLEGLGPIAHRTQMPEGPRPPYRQRLYRLQGCPEHLMVDFCVMHPDRLGPFLDPDRHGQPLIWHDPEALLTPRSDHEVAERRQARWVGILERTPLLAHLPAKAIDRGRVVEASERYRRHVLGPLVEVLRIRHCPERFDFGLRYLPDDLPAAVVERLRPLAFPRDPDDLRTCIAQARAWLEEELAAGPVIEDGPPR